MEEVGRIRTEEDRDAEVKAMWKKIEKEMYGMGKDRKVTGKEAEEKLE
jgi:hypothetical protein